MAVIVGASRSGTTLLQNVLGAHPEVVTPQETHVFHNYCRLLIDMWNFDERRYDGIQRPVGLPTIIEREELIAAVRELPLAVVRASIARKPGATVFVEKTPSNSLETDLINEMFPDCRFIHVIRDPFAVVASLVAAGGSDWARQWAPKDVHAAALRWRRDFSMGRRGAEYGPDRYLEVRYESLASGSVDAVTDTLSLLGVDQSPALAKECLAQGLSGLSTYVTRREPQPEPSGFARTARDHDGRPTLTEVEAAEVNRLCGDLAAELGYATPGPLTLATRAGLNASRGLRIARLVTDRLGRLPARARAAVKASW
jgi:hypothetical protein